MKETCNCPLDRKGDANHGSECVKYKWTPEAPLKDTKAPTSQQCNCPSGPSKGQRHLPSCENFKKQERPNMKFAPKTGSGSLAAAMSQAPGSTTGSLVTKARVVKKGSLMLAIPALLGAARMKGSEPKSTDLKAYLGGYRNLSPAGNNSDTEKYNRQGT